VENNPLLGNRVPLDKQQVRERVADYLHEHGLYKMKRADILEHMQGKLSDTRVPTLNEIGETLKSDFKIRYLRDNPASVRYRDPEIDERRKWASRVLAHLLHEDFMIISIDETHIRSDKSSHYSWQFAANERPFKRVLAQGIQQEQEHEIDREGMESEVGEISSEVSKLSVKGFKLEEVKEEKPKRPRGRPKKVVSEIQ